MMVKGQSLFKLLYVVNSNLKININVSPWTENTVPFKLNGKEGSKPTSTMPNT